MDKKFLRDVPLPEDLTNDQIYEAMLQTQSLISDISNATGVALANIIQANNFSGVVSNIFTKKLSDLSCYKEFSEQRYPDLLYTEKNIGLEVKASNKPWKGGEGHNGHSGWHIIVCFEKQTNGEIEFVQAEIARLNGFEEKDSDWKYQGSKRNSNNSQRTETYVTTAEGTAKLRDGTVYLDPKVNPTKGMITAREKIGMVVPSYSPFLIRPKEE